MNEEKQKLGRVAAVIFGGIEKNIADVVAAKQIYKSDLAKLNEGKRDYSEDYLERKRSDLKAKYNQARQTAYQKIDKSLDDLKSILEEKHATLDLQDPAWVNALKLIELGGATLDTGTIQKINDSFQYDQPAIRALQSIYKAKGIVYDGSLDQQVYEIDPSFKDMKQTAEAVLLYDGGTIGALARSVGKIAKMEGVPFETSPDPDALEEAFRIGAGLVAEQ